MDNIDGIWVEKTDETYKNREFNYMVKDSDIPRIHIKCSNGDGFYKTNLYRIV